ncbi:hypothetical protein V1264_022812 [Littorina saxatilis]|uniref:SAM domain-containing protein n=1 Tax=Littorina saxatilis TaxID=31220 RepID=A0AAN9G9S5_9CAEN
MNVAAASAEKDAPAAEQLQTTTEAALEGEAATGKGEREDGGAENPPARSDTMGKTADGGEGLGTDTAQESSDKPGKDDVSKTDENGLGYAGADDKNGESPAGDADDQKGGDEGEVSANPQGGVPDIKEDDVNFNDSVSNIRSQPERANETKSAKDVKFIEQGKAGLDSSLHPMSQTPRMKRSKKGIFVSYSPDAGFLERRFVVEMVRQMKENNLAEDIWFDKDEKNTDGPCWFSLRMETVEKCRAAILILSDSYFSCPVSLYEGKVLLERQSMDPTTVKVFSVLFSQVENAEIPKQYLQAMTTAVDLNTEKHVKKSSAEKTSVVIGAIMEELEKFATVNAPPVPFTPPDTEFTGEYKKKKICQWNAADLQEWLFNLGIKEFYRQSLAEAMVDGFLLMSMTDRDMVSQLGIDSRVVRKKIMQQILSTLDKEHKQSDNWHLRARAQRSKPDVVYLIYDPADVRLAQNLKADLKKKSLQVRG